MYFGVFGYICYVLTHLRLAQLIYPFDVISACAQSSQWGLALHTLLGISSASLLPDLIAYNAVIIVAERGWRFECEFDSLWSSKPKIYKNDIQIYPGYTKYISKYKIPSGRGRRGTPAALGLGRAGCRLVFCIYFVYVVYIGYF